MKESEALRIAMDAVIDSQYNNNIRIAVLKVLYKLEDLALMVEGREESTVTE